MPHIALMAQMTSEGLRITEFAELMQVTKSAVSQLVTWLEEHGLVERVPDPADRRATLVRATRAADAGFTVARHRYAEIEDEWERVIRVDGLASLAKTLQQLESARPPKARSHRKRGRSGSSRATPAPRS